ncbi:MATE family efflux transporter [Prevotella sp.]|uniref:MATE family efflux transporter n=1 Tax=Prevotella sp. TaxID=59823 RepID=UPI0025F5B2B6|nr:MATE family efflux transporter [Prevotella sp.]MCI6130425.1 MATE family efflux transporter [Prevotella sp.]MDY4645463.1 MATE family efflux transporter [Prevotella sp.]
MTSQYNNHYRTLLSIGIPIMIGQLGMIILSFADTMMVGHHSTSELGAASFVNNIMNLVIITGTGFSYGLTPIVGGMFGRKQLPEAGQALRCSLLANTLAAVIMMAALTILYFNLANIGQPDELLLYMRPYYLVLLASLPFVMLFNAFKQFTDSITETRTSMWILLSGNLLNIIGNYILIYGKMGVPEMGVVGAGVSTLISRIVMVGIFLAVFLCKRSMKQYREGFFSLGWSRQLVRRLTTLGTPIALEMGMETASFSLSIIMVGWLGTIALASHQVMSTISQFTFMVYYGLGAAVAVRTSYFHGQGDTTNTRHVVTAGLRLMVMLEILLGGIIFLLRKDIGSWFTDSAEVSASVLTLMLPFFIYQFGDGLQINYANALRGIADVKPLMVIAFIAFFVISLPVGYLCGFVMGYGLVGVWMAFPFGLTSAGIMMWWRFRKMMNLANRQ